MAAARSQSARSRKCRSRRRIRSTPKTSSPPTALALRKVGHGTLDKVSTGIERMHFNVCLAHIREFTNALADALAQISDKGGGTPAPDLAWAVREAAVILVQLISPMMPHLAEEC